MDTLRQRQLFPRMCHVGPERILPTIWASCKGKTPTMRTAWSQGGELYCRHCGQRIKVYYFSVRLKVHPKQSQPRRQAFERACDKIYMQSYLGRKFIRPYLRRI